MTRRLLLLALIVLCVPVPSAAAQAPPRGDWTAVNKDSLRHYACRYKAKGDWNVRTATPMGDLREDIEKYDFQTYAALARGSNDNVPEEANSKSWTGGYARTVLRDARLTDRVWVQLAVYGPPAPWSDGYTVRRLKVC